MISVLSCPTSCRRATLPAHYDMVAVSVVPTPSKIHVGDKVVFKHTVRNDGKDVVPVKAYEVDLYVDGTRVAFDHDTSAKGPEGETTYNMAPGSHHWQPAKPGKYRYRLIVDEANTLPETNEVNNTLEGDIEVLP